MLGVAAVAVKNTRIIVKDVPGVPVAPSSQPPPGLKPSPVTSKYLCPNSTVCEWTQIPKTTEGITCVTKDTEKCTYEIMKNECDATKRGSSNYGNSYRAGEFSCFIGPKRCKWSIPDILTKTIKLIDDGNCDLDLAESYCKDTDGKFESKTLECIYRK
jgi:hypothetical protein